jgi:glutaredoxin
MKPITIDLYTARTCVACPPAKKLAKKLQQMFPNVTLNIKDIEEYEDEVQELNLSAVPTWIITNETEGHKIAGVSSIQTLQKSIRELAA